MSLTKLMSGTPGTMNSAHAISGCHGVVEIIHDGMPAIIAGSVERSAVAQASNVATKAEMPMAT